MRTSILIKNSLWHYWRTNLAVILGVATAVAVLAGALLVGDSVRASLRDLALARLGKTDLVINSSGFFREQLAADLQSPDQFAENFRGACPLIVLEGVVTRDENKARAGNVQVYGVDERFWKFHGVNVQAPDDNDVLLSQALAQELNAMAGDTIILRIENTSAIPAESPHGRKDDLGRTIRFTMRRALPMSSLGEFSIRPQQGAVRAMFVPLRKLQRNLEQENKTNAILLSARRANSPSARVVEKILKDKFTLADVGLKLRVLDEQRVLSLESESMVIGDALAEKAKRAAGISKLKTSSILTYLANTIRVGKKEIPYSLVTALDEEGLGQFRNGDHTRSLKSWLYTSGEGTYTDFLKLRAGIGSPQTNDSPIILNEWAARNLGVEGGEVAELEYYLWEEAGRLATGKKHFRVVRITPMEGIATDRDLAPEYPGITEARSLADWDPPFPIELSRIRRIDELYWDYFRTTPKAFILLSQGQELWATRYGKLTSIRILPPDNLDLESVRREYERGLRHILDPAQMGLSVQSVKEQSMQASRGATDFGQYFTYFSLFLVVSALLLTTLFFRLGIEQRLREIGLLRSVGYSIKQVRSIFLREGFALALMGSIIGVVGAVGYGALMMWGLSTWWVGAVGTTLLRLHITPQSLLIGGIAGIIAALVCVWWTLRRLTPASPRSLLSGVNEIDSPRRRGATARRRLFSSARLAVIFGLIGLTLLIAAGYGRISQVGGFFGAGILLLIAILFFWSAWLRDDRKQTIAGHGLWPMTRLGFRNASSRPGRSVLCIALIASAAFIIVSVDSFRREGKAATLDKSSGNGGYPLLAESLLPIVQDPNSEQEREELNLNDETLRDVNITRFRLRPGDDSSCLNLYQPRNPRIIATADDFIKSGRFAFQSSLAGTDEEKANPWLLLNQEMTESPSINNPQAASGPGRNPQTIIPVIADANSMTYVLHLKLGDEITVNASDGSVVRLRLVAALADSIFQGELLMSGKNFLKLFPDQEGYRFFLIDAPPERAAAVAHTLEERLSDFGFDAMSTEEKIAGFHQVENTYLSTFQALGGLGLLLGTLGLAAVLLRNVFERQRELALMRAVGYQSSHLAWMVVTENALMLGCGLMTGVLCALLAITPAFIARGGRLSAVSLGILLFAVSITGLAASLIAVRAVIRSPLLPALRTE
ncbi:MAG: FtsX-like permease family protein [Acidobacteria bacterium]|nr:FtsX-like permease family protein [Acidobacteriota bacterium]